MQSCKPVSETQHWVSSFLKQTNKKVKASLFVSKLTGTTVTVTKIKRMI